MDVVENISALHHFPWLCKCVSVLQEREGRKDMEPRSEDGQFEEVTVQQLPRLEHGGNPVRAHAHTPAIPTLLPFSAKIH